LDMHSVVCYRENSGRLLYKIRFLPSLFLYDDVVYGDFSECQLYLGRSI
jgi:hypothetical protein